MTNQNDTLYEKFIPVAEKEAKKIKRTFGGYLRLYEEGDLINWAYLSGFWSRYVDKPGAMRIVIRFAMLRSLEKARVETDGTVRNLQSGVAYGGARAAGLVDKNQPTNVKSFHKYIAATDLISPQAENPVLEASLHEIEDIIRTSKQFDEKDKEILLRRLMNEDTLTEISSSINMSLNGTSVRYHNGVRKLRSMIDADPL